jgi:hypothetical protein
MTESVEQINEPIATNDDNLPYATNDDNLVRLALNDPGQEFSNCVNTTMRSPSSCIRKYNFNGIEADVNLSMFGTFACVLMNGNVSHLLENIESINQLINAFDVIQERFPPELSYIYSTPVMSPIFSVCIRSTDDENNTD